MYEHNFSFFYISKSPPKSKNITFFSSRLYIPAAHRQPPLQDSLLDTGGQNAPRTSIYGGMKDVGGVSLCALRGRT